LQISIALLNFLFKRHKHVSWQRLLSGRGIVTIWEYLTQKRKKESPSWLLEQIKDTDPAPVISKAALESSYGGCIETIQMFNR